MNDYRTYDAYALSSDASFRAWVLNPAAEQAAFWTNWLAENPDRVATVEQAKAFIVAVQQQYTSPVSDDEVRAGADRLLTQVRTQAEPEPAIIALNSRRIGWVRWVAAAAVLILVVGVGWQAFRARFGSDASDGSSINAPTAWVDRVNTGRESLAILLEDSSVVTLEPGSRLRHPRQFAAHQRAVTLVGEAFFEVAHRPQQPFVVSTADFTTTVLGTSFRVRSSTANRRAFVMVRSGKVAVQARSATRGPVAETDVRTTPSPVILVRNQQVEADRQSPQPLQRTVVKDADLIRNEVNKAQTFDDVAVSAVFEALEKQYGVSIEYDRAVLSRCLINTAFAEENLRERLSAVCQAVGATYQIADDKILISSTGCTL